MNLQVMFGCKSVRLGICKYWNFEGKVTNFYNFERSVEFGSNSNRSVKCK